MGCVAPFLFILVGFLLGIRFGYQAHKSESFPKRIIEEPRFQVIYIDPKIVRKMYGIAEPTLRR
jgi:xanthosine utilization system XapX-like protein